MGTPNREPQEYSRNIVEYTYQGPYILLNFYYILGVSFFGVPIRVPLKFRF